MRKIILIPVLILLLATLSGAQWLDRAITVKFGNFNPKNIGNSYLICANLTYQLSVSDEIGIGINYYGKHERDILTLKDKYLVGPILETEIQTVAKRNVHLIPMYGIYIFRIPLSPRNTLFFSGTAGYDFLLSNYKDYYQENESVKNQYRGFSWSLGTGFMYRLNHQIVCVLEAAYTFSKVSRSKPTESAPIEGIVDISGFSLRFGLRRSLF